MKRRIKLFTNILPYLLIAFCVVIFSSSTWAATPQLKAADLDGNSYKDLLYMDSDGYVWFLKDITTNTSWTKLGNNKLTTMIVGDFDADGKDEIVGINANGYTKFAADNAAYSASTTWIKVGMNKFTQLLSGDFDGDGEDELVGLNANKYAKYCSDNSASWFSDRAEPSTTNWQTKIGTNKFTKLVAGDFDANGTEELIGLNANGYAKYCSDDSTQWVSDKASPSTTNWKSKIGMNKFSALITADVTGNTADELVGINYNGYAKYNTDNSAAWVSRQDSPSTTNWKPKIGINKFKYLASGNFDGSGKDELVGVNFNGYAKFNSDNAAAWVSRQDSPSTTNWSTKIGTRKFTTPLIVADFDGDSEADLAGLNPGYHVLYNTDNGQGWGDSTTWTKITAPSE